MGQAASDAAANFLASWEHVESILRHERLNDGKGDRLLTLVARLRDAGYDRRLLARRAWRAPLVLGRSASRILDAREPVIVFVYRRDQIVALIGTREAFVPCDVADGGLPPQLARALALLAHEAAS
jgi:hypothetical protein